MVMKIVMIMMIVMGYILIPFVDSGTYFRYIVPNVNTALELIESTTLTLYIMITFLSLI